MRILRMLFWETTICCNLACAHCRRLESNEAGIADLSAAQAKPLIEQLADLGHRQPQMPVLVFSGGEPLCRGDLFDLIEEARQHGIIVALATNGTLIDRDKAQRIHDSGIARVSVSLDGAAADTHDRMRQIPGAFDQAIEGIRQLHEHGVPFQINVTLTKQNASQLQEVYGLARLRDIDALEGKCGLCGYKHLCGGCRARAFGMTGNYMAEEPFCAYVPPKVRAAGG